MSVISDFLKQILTAYYGKDVRQSIHDAIKQCYDDATGNPESVAAVVEQNDKMKELLENTPYTTVESEGEFELPVHTINDNEIGAYSTWSSKKIIDAIYPVGSIYMSVNNVNPSELLGGTWVAWGAGRVPVGVDPTDKAFNTVEKKSGEQVHVLTQSELPPTIEFKTDSIGFQVYGEGTTEGEEVATPFGSNTTLTLINSGGGKAHNNLQPYITCYMWKRTD